MLFNVFICKYNCRYRLYTLFNSVNLMRNLHMSYLYLNEHMDILTVNPKKFIPISTMLEQHSYRIVFFVIAEK